MESANRRALETLKQQFYCIVCGTHTFMVDKVLQIHFCGWECREDYLRMMGWNSKTGGAMQ